MKGDARRMWKHAPEPPTPAFTRGAGRLGVAATFLATVGLFALLFVLAAFGLPWVSIGPDGGTVTALVLDPTNPTTLYAGTERGGVYKSMNGGASWQAMSTGLRNPDGFLYSVSALPLDPTIPTTLYTGTNGAVFKYVAVPPPATDLVSPSSTVMFASPTYSWSAEPMSSGYCLWVSDSTARGKLTQWYTAAQAGCGSGTGTCSATPPTALASGAAQWWIQPWNADGYGPWGAGLSITVSP